MQSQTKRYKTPKDQASKDHQLSGLFNIISNNLLTATEVLGNEHNFGTIQELEIVSKKAKNLSKELTKNINDTDLTERISVIKNKMLELINDLSNELGRLDPSKSKDQKAIEDIILARRLLRESQRGLSTL